MAPDHHQNFTVSVKLPLPLISIALHFGNFQCNSLWSLSLYRYSMLFSAGITLRFCTTNKWNLNFKHQNNHRVNLYPGKSGMSGYKLKNKNADWQSEDLDITIDISTPFRGISTNIYPWKKREPSFRLERLLGWYQLSSEGQTGTSGIVTRGAWE